MKNGLLAAAALWAAAPTFAFHHRFAAKNPQISPKYAQPVLDLNEQEHAPKFAALSLNLSEWKRLSSPHLPLENLSPP